MDPKDIAEEAPLDALVLAAKLDPILDKFINERASEILQVELPKLAIVVDEGKSMRVADLEPMTKTVADALDYHIEHAEDNTITPQLRSIAVELADCMDRALATILVDEELLDRGLHLDLLSSHAHIISVLSGIKLEPWQKAIIAEEQADAESDPSA